MFIPRPDGSFAEFEFLATQVLENSLANQYPDIKTFMGIQVDDPSVGIRYDVTPAGFHAQVSTSDGIYYVSPIIDELYISFFTNNFSDSVTFDCEENHASLEPIHELMKSIKPLVNYGTSKRTYRIAVAATGEYTAAVGGTQALALSSIATALNFINAIYEVEIGVRLQLIANNMNIIYTNASTDPYNPSAGNVAMLSQNQTNVNSVIGSANYDIGHLFHALVGSGNSGSGVANLRSVCSTNFKARGVFTATHKHEFGGYNTFTR